MGDSSKVVLGLILGGIFVFPVVGNAVMYLVSLIVGTVISAVLLGLLKKKVA